MQEYPYKSTPPENPPFMQNIQDARTLLQTELSLNHSEQALLEQRILVMNQFVNDLSANDPQYSMVRVALQMDQIELDELRTRARYLGNQLEIV